MSLVNCVSSSSFLFMSTAALTATHITSSLAEQWNYISSRPDCLDRFAEIINETDEIDSDQIGQLLPTCGFTQMNQSEVDERFAIIDQSDKTVLPDLSGRNFLVVLRDEKDNFSEVLSATQFIRDHFIYYLTYGSMNTESYQGYVRSDYEKFLSRCTFWQLPSHSEPVMASPARDSGERPQQHPILGAAQAVVGKAKAALGR